MHYLHPVQMHEKFVASGTYQAAIGTVGSGLGEAESVEPGAVVEKWSIHEQPGGTRLVRIDYDSSSALFLIEAWVNIGAQGRVVDRIDLYARSKIAQTVIQTARVTYSFFDDHIQVGRTLNDQPRDHFEIGVLVPYIGGFPLSWLLYGYTAARAAQYETAVACTVPYINLNDMQAFRFTTDFPRIQVRQVREDTLQLGNRQYSTSGLQVDWYSHEHPQTPRTEQLYLDGNDVLLKLEPLSPGLTGQTSLTLMDYARRPT